MAHQNLYQLQPPDLRSAVNNYAQSKIFFQSVSEDARVMARDFKPLTEDDFMSFQQHNGAARIATSKGVSQPMTFEALPPAKGYGTAEQVLRQSREKYGRPEASVREEIARRHQPQRRADSGPQRRPSIGTWSDLGGE